MLSIEIKQHKLVKNNAVCSSDRKFRYSNKGNFKEIYCEGHG